MPTIYIYIYICIYMYMHVYTCTYMVDWLRHGRRAAVAACFVPIWQRATCRSAQATSKGI